MIGRFLILVCWKQQGRAAFPMKRRGSLMLPVIFAQALRVTRSLIFFLPAFQIDRPKFSVVASETEAQFRHN